MRNLRIVAFIPVITALLLLWAPDALPQDDPREFGDPVTLDDREWVAVSADARPVPLSDELYDLFVAGIVDNGDETRSLVAGKSTWSIVGEELLASFFDTIPTGTSRPFGTSPIESSDDIPGLLSGFDQVVAYNEGTPTFQIKGAAFGFLNGVLNFQSFPITVGGDFFSTVDSTTDGNELFYLGENISNNSLDIYNCDASLNCDFLNDITPEGEGEFLRPAQNGGVRPRFIKLNSGGFLVLGQIGTTGQDTDDIVIFELDESGEIVDTNVIDQVEAQTENFRSAESDKASCPEDLFAFDNIFIYNALGVDQGIGEIMISIPDPDDPSGYKTVPVGEVEIPDEGFNGVSVACDELLPAVGFAATGVPVGSNVNMIWGDYLLIGDDVIIQPDFPLEVVDGPVSVLGLSDNLGTVVTGSLDFVFFSEPTPPVPPPDGNGNGSGCAINDVNSNPESPLVNLLVMLLPLMAFLFRGWKKKNTSP